MSKYKIILILIPLIIVTACSSDTQNIKLIKEKNQEEEKPVDKMQSYNNHLKQRKMLWTE